MPRSPGAPTLVLVPTQREAARLFDGAAPGFGLVELCGFGPLAAAARAAASLERLRPRRVVLAGIAGTYDAERLPVGAAARFGSVALDGVGVGAGADLRGPAALGFPQWAGLDGRRAIGERLDLAGGGGLLLTVCAASDGARVAAERRARFQGALAEDMEAFGVALACALAGVPLSVVRGASNVAGERDHAAWRVDDALDAARAALEEIL
jgi:futalosine hydrolase